MAGVTSRQREKLSVDRSYGTGRPRARGSAWLGGVGAHPPPPAPHIARSTLHATWHGHKIQTKMCDHDVRYVVHSTIKSQSHTSQDTSPLFSILYDTVLVPPPRPSHIYIERKMPPVPVPSRLHARTQSFHIVDTCTLSRDNVTDTGQTNQNTCLHTRSSRWHTEWETCLQPKTRQGRICQTT